MNNEDEDEDALTTVLDHMSRPSFAARHCLHYFLCRCVMVFHFSGLHMRMRGCAHELRG